MPVNRKIFISNNDDDLLNELVENYIDEEYLKQMTLMKI